MRRFDGLLINSNVVNIFVIFHFFIMKFNLLLCLNLGSEKCAFCKAKQLINYLLLLTVIAHFRNVNFARIQEIPYSTVFYFLKPNWNINTSG